MFSSEYVGRSKVQRGSKRNVGSTIFTPMCKNIFQLQMSHIFTRPLTGIESTSGNSVHLSVCLSICLSVITSTSFPFSSDSKLTQPLLVHISHATSPTVSNVPHPCLPCQSTSPPSQSTGPPMNRIITFPSEVELCVNLTFFLCH